MRVGIAEVLYPKGHKELDINTINAISKVADVCYFSYDYFLDNSRLSKAVKVFQVKKQFDLQHIAKLITFSRIINLLFLRNVIKKNKIQLDALVLLSFDNTLTRYVAKIFPELKIFVIHHDDVDKIPESLPNNEKLFYKSIHHIVYEDYIKQGLISKTQCEDSMVHVVPHPLVFEAKIEKKPKTRKVILSIGWSNDENLITQLISLCKELKEELPYRIIIRSKNQSYKDDNLEVISGFLSKEEYDNLIKSADLQAILYPNTFKYRYSATFQTALLQGCYVLVNDVFIGRELNRMYPNSTHVISEVKELLELDEAFLKKEPSNSDIQSMLTVHAEQNISAVFERIIS